MMQETARYHFFFFFDANEKRQCIGDRRNLDLDHDTLPLSPTAPPSFSLSLSLTKQQESAKVLEAQNLIKRLNEVRLLLVFFCSSLVFRARARSSRALENVFLSFSSALMIPSLPPPPPPPTHQDSDILASLPAFRSFSRNGVDAALTCAKARELPKPLAEELFAVCKKNMEAAYDAAWGWSDGAKRAELTHDAARFILVSEKKKKETEGGDVAASASASAAAADDSSLVLSSLAANPSDLLAYVHFRFETDEGTQKPILYVYEVQLRDAPKTRRKGLGRFLMQLLELSARKHGAGLEAITLTVQDSNHAAAALYASLGYVRDECSPCPLEEPEAGYTILTKALPPPPRPPLGLSKDAGGNGGSSKKSVSGSGSTAAASTKAGVAAAAAALSNATVSSPAAAAVGK